MAGVEKIEIEGPNGFEIHATIHLPSVASVNEGREVAEKALWAALDCIIFHHDIAVENPLRKDDQAAVDALIKNQVPTVRETPQPPILRSRTRHKNPVMEMVYTKLRNELGPKRAGVNLENTKRAMGLYCLPRGG